MTPHARLARSFALAARPVRAAQRGVSLVFAMITVVALSLAAVALIRSVDTGVTILGNLSFKQDTLLAADDASRMAVSWLQTKMVGSADALNVDLPSEGYSARLIAGLDPTSTQTSATRVAVDWNNDSCQSQRGPTPARCVKPSAALTLKNGITARYLIQRLCSDQGSTTSGNISCPRPINSTSLLTGERGEINSQNPTRIGSSTLSEYYRIVVRAQGSRNTVSTTETLVRF